MHHRVLRHGFERFFQCPPNRFVGQGVDELEFDGFVGQQAQGPAISTRWRCRAGQLGEVRFNPAIDFWRHRRCVARLSQQRGFGPIDNGSLAPVLKRSFGYVEGIGDLSVAPRRSQLALVAFQQRLGAGDLPGRDDLSASCPFGNLQQMLVFRFV